MAKLKITRCVLQSDSIVAQSGAGNIFDAVINPESYKHNFALKYTGGDDPSEFAVGKSAPVMTYASADPETLDFTIVLDGTGVVPDAQEQTVGEQMDKLRAIVYDYDGEEHEPSPVQIDWGRGLTAFLGRLTSMAVDYTLFHPDGAPLRAKVSLSFVEARTATQEALEAGRSSPGLTHLVRTRAGDTLPLLCQRIYKDPSRYLDVARWNDLDGLRDLAPDRVLQFRPIR